MIWVPFETIFCFKSTSTTLTDVNMPQNTLPPLFARSKLSLDTNDKPWNQVISLVGSNEQLRGLNDQVCGEINHWFKQKSKRKPFRSTTTYTNNLTGKLHRYPRCNNCGGLLSDRARFDNYYSQTNTSLNHGTCEYGHHYCDVVGPCRHCRLERKRQTIFENQLRDFPDIEVSASKLIAPLVAETMIAPKCFQEYREPGACVLRLPTPSDSTLRYMKRMAGSTKQKRKHFPSNIDSNGKKFIEVRLPKIWVHWK